MTTNKGIAQEFADAGIIVSTLSLREDGGWDVWSQWENCQNHWVGIIYRQADGWWDFMREEDTSRAFGLVELAAMLDKEQRNWSTF